MARNKTKVFKVGGFVRFVEGYKINSDQHENIDDAINGTRINRFKVHYVDANSLGVCFCTDFKRCIHDNDNYNWSVYHSACVPIRSKRTILIHMASKDNDSKRQDYKSSKV